MTLRDHAGINAGDPTLPALLEGLIGPPAWTAEAICAQVVDPDLFFPDKGANSPAAKAVCRRCPVRQKCLDYALDFESGAAGTATSNAQVGIYGGLSPRERRAILRGRRPVTHPYPTLQEPA
jgi:WhiB family redox-sensing transcriptional regulator